jgi:GNAT superfamily N-acetyltransferase
MRDYYAQYAADWDESKVLSVTANLINYDIQIDGDTVGVMRLEYEGNTCILRDLQVIPSAQNKGIGSAAIEEAERLALGPILTRLTYEYSKLALQFRFIKKWDLSLKVKTTAFLT